MLSGIMEVLSLLVLALLDPLSCFQMWKDSGAMSASILQDVYVSEQKPEWKKESSLHEGDPGGRMANIDVKCLSFSPCVPLVCPSFIFLGCHSSLLTQTLMVLPAFSWAAMLWALILGQPGESRL